MTLVPVRLSRLRDELVRRVAGQVRFDRLSRLLYSTDASIYQIEPLGVVLPRSDRDVQAVVEVAQEYGVPLLPRGGGTSLSGQAVGPALVIDFSKYLNRVLAIDAERQTARVQAGVVLDQLNQAAAAYGLQFGPDVATSNRACLGGMIGNNSAGARSIHYGKTCDHVVQLQVVLSDGQPARLEPVSLAEWQRRCRRPGIEGQAYAAVDRLVRQNCQQIRQRFPRIQRRVSGYNLDLFVAALCGDGGCPDGSHTQLAATSSPAARFDPARPLNLSNIVVGAEGTLAVVTEAVLRLVPLPPARGLVMVHFDRMDDALESLETILGCGPSAVELIDKMLLDLGRQNLSAARQMEYVRGDPEAILMVEFSGQSQWELAERADALAARLAARRGTGELVRALEPPLRDAIWNLRKAGAGLLMGLPAARRPVSIVEDTAVAPSRLAAFVRRFRQILARNDTLGAVYGHASVGCLHIRPLLDLKSAADVKRMRDIAEAVTDLVLEFGGTMSGEHGDGLARSMWVPKMFGPELYRAFCALKAAFDPQGLMNPGKIVGGPDLGQNLRYRPPYRLSEPPTLLDFSDYGGMGGAVEQCSGVGTCRKLAPGTMCPSFMATRDEQHSTRGRANALRAALAGQLSPHLLDDPRLLQTLELCLMCKGCRAECPANVDMARLKAEFLHQYYRNWGLPLANRLLGHIRTLNRLGALLPGLTNALLRSAAVKRLLEWVAGLDRRRTLPTVAAEPLARWFRRHVPPPGAGRAGMVLLFDDCFTSYNEPEVGRAAVKLLEAAGYRVQLASVGCCGRAMISQGLLSEARKRAEENVAALKDRVGPQVPLLGCEPSCLLTFTDEYRHFRLGRAADHLAQAAWLVEDWLAAGVAAGRLRLPLRPRPARVLLHGHCHQKALVGTAGTEAALRLVPELEVRVLDAGCCGMAGAFGYERQHYEVSRQVAARLLAACNAQPEAILVAPGFSCRCQLQDLADRQALHPLVLLAEQLDRDGR